MPSNACVALDENWCSQSEAARRLGNCGDPVAQQVLSRYLARYPEIPRRSQGRGAAMLVDFAALRLHRSQNIHVIEHSVAVARAEPAIDEAASLRMRERQAAAELREIELRRAREDFIPRAAVEAAVSVAKAALHEVLASSRAERAAAHAAVRDVRQAAILLDEQDQAIQAGYAAALAKAAGG